MNRLKSWAPYLVLLAEVLIFHRYTLLGKTIIPWDIRAYHLQQAVFVSKSLRDGELPLWTPFIYCGHPFAANIQAALFYPPRFLATLLGGTSAYGMLYSLEVELIAHIFLAGLFCFVLLRELGLNRAAALLGATSFQLGAFFASQAEHLGAIEGAAWLPCIWLLVLRLSRAFRRRDALLLSAAMSMPILCGFVPLTTVIFLASGLLVFLLVALHKASPKLIVVFAACGLGSALLAGVALFPGIQLMLLSVSRFRTDWMGKGGGLPLSSLYSLVWPNKLGILDRGAYKGPVDMTLLYLYSGTVTLLGAVSLLLRRQSPRAVSFFVLFCVSALFMLGESTPFGSLYTYILPASIRGAIYPQEWIAPFSLSLCILGACGISRYVSHRGVGIALIVFSVCDLTWFGSNRPFNATSKTAEPGVTESAFAGSTQLLNAVRYFAGETKPPARIDTINDSLDWAGSAVITGVPSANGADPLVLIRYIQARLAFAKGERWGYYYQVTNPASPVLQSLNICCLLTRSRIPQDQLAHSAYSSVVDVPGGFLYNTKTVLPRFHLVHQTVAAANMAEAAVLSKNPTWNPGQLAIVEGLAAQQNSSDPNDLVTITRYQRNSISLITDSHAPSFLVSSEANYPGWKVTIDGRAARIYDTNVAFRGVQLSAGKHVVNFKFRPKLLTLSSIVSALGWAVVLFLLLRRHFRFLKITGLHNRELRSV